MVKEATLQHVKGGKNYMEEGKHTYITEQRVSEITGIALPTLRNWRHKNIGFPYFRIGRKAIRYREDIIRESVEAGRINPNG
jgi:hypothetical protein